MADLYELIERVQVTLASSRSPEIDQLRELHGELDGQIRRANKRLRECDALLANGHRTEAIQLAEQEPPLLDVVAVLDFAELPEWNDFVAELGLTVTPELQIDIAADLNRAYSEDAPLERHLRQFRLYSLGRAPLRSRIAILKQIASLDSDNPVWQSDLSRYEEVRLRQIKDEYREANRNQDLERLRSLASELRGDWLVQPGRQLSGKINQAIKSINAARSIEQLKQVAGDLQQAREDEDLDWARELSRDWQSLAKACAELDECRNLTTRVRPILNWLKQERQQSQASDDFQRALDRLQRAIDARREPAELDKRFAAVARTGFDVPAEIEEEYEEAVAHWHRRRRTRTAFIAACAGAFAIVAGLIIWLVFRE